MLAVLGVVGVAAYGLVSVLVGARLLRLAARSGQLPEAALGAGLLVGVLLGYLPETLVTSTDWASPTVRGAVLAGTQIGIRLAALSILFFTWRVFRRDEAWARLLGGGIALAMAASWVGFPSFHADIESRSDWLWYEVFVVSRFLALAWGATESAREYRASRLRLRLGLADPAVSRRFLLWAVALGASALLMGSTLWAELSGVDPTAAGWVLLESAFGLVGAVALWLTFLGGPMRDDDAGAEAAPTE